MESWKMKMVEGSAAAVSHLAAEIAGQASSGEVNAQTVDEALTTITDFRRHLRTLKNNGAPPTRKTRSKKA